MFDETPDKADESADDTPIVERTEEEWKNHFGTLLRNKLGSIFEIAKWITRFHIEVNNNPAKWNFNWRVVCKRVVGLDHTTCSQYEKVHTVFSGLEGYEDILPPKSYTLYLIASAFGKTCLDCFQGVGKRHHFTGYDPRRRAGTSHFGGAQCQNSRKLGPVAGWEKKPPREPRTENPQKPPATDEQKQEKKWKKAEEEARQEALALDEAFLSLPRIKADLKLEESEYCRRTISHEIDEKGGEIEEEVLRQVLNARVNHPEFFYTMYMWDKHFQQMAVTLALRELGYK